MQIISRERVLLTVRPLIMELSGILFFVFVCQSAQVYNMLITQQEIVFKSAQMILIYMVN